MDFTHYYTDALKKYADFSGRASRKEYWMFFLCNVIVMAVLWTLSFMMHNAVLYWLYLLALLVPGLAVGVRRLHDTNHSGWWYLICAIPFIGALVILIFLVSAGQPGQNRFDATPKGV